MLKHVVVAFGLLLVYYAGYADESLIPYEVHDRSTLGTQKFSIDLFVDLVDERLPNVGELEAISNSIVQKTGKFERYFVTFYLPGMEVGSGAFATAHHNPDLEVKILEFILMVYPQYQKFVDE